jgi:hypothetical protein
MGLDAYAHLVVAIPMSRSDLYRTVGSRISCPNGHDQPNSAPKFCPEDGGRFENRKTEEPTPEFAKYLKENDWEPEDVEDEDVGLPDVPEYDWMSVARVKSGDEKEDHLGKVIFSTGSHRRSGGPSEVDMKEVEKEIAALQALAKRLGVKREVKVFLSLRMSY